MALFQPTELHRFLREHEISANKALSQNFLIDGNIVRKIRDAAKISPDDVLLEIGPGPGALSELLLESGATLLAVEKDRTLASALHRLQTPDQRLHVFEDDILNFPVEERLAPFLKNGKKAKLVANLPYSLTTPILSRFVPLFSLFSHIIVMVQEEVARRFVADAGEKDYGSYSLFLRFYSNPRYAFRVGRRCFFPVPNVDSAVVELTLKEPPQMSDSDAFFTLTRRAFQQRRKMMRSSLKELYPAEKIVASLEHIGKPETSRPEELRLEEFLALFHSLDSMPLLNHPDYGIQSCC